MARRFHIGEIIMYAGAKMKIIDEDGKRGRILLMNATTYDELWVSWYDLNCLGQKIKEVA